MESFNILELGASPDGQTLNTPVIQEALDRCAAAGGGTVIVPPGRFLSGHLLIGSGTTLRLEAGAVLVSSPDLKDHVRDGKIAGLILCRSASGVRITGQGSIDGNPAPFFDFAADHDAGDADFDPSAPRSPDGPVKPLGRPGNLVVFSGCDNILIEDIAIRGSSYWTVHLADCRDASIQNLTIDHDQSIPNNDGIHLTNSRRITVTGCRITSGDDCIAVSGWRSPKSEPEIQLGFTDKPGACEDIFVSNCVFSSRSAAVRVWTNETDVRRVRFSNLIVNSSNRGLGIFSRGPGSISDIVFENIRLETRYHAGRWWGKAEPIHLSSVPVESGIAPGEIRNVMFRNIEAVSDNGIVLYSSKPGAVRDVELSGVRLTLTDGRFAEKNAGILDIRPVVQGLTGLIKTGSRSLIADGIRGLEIRNLTVIPVSGRHSHFLPGPRFDRCESLRVEGYRERRPGGE